MTSSTILPRETHTITARPLRDHGILSISTEVNLSEPVRRGKRRKHRTMGCSTITAYRSERKRQYRRAMRSIQRAAADLDYAPPRTTRALLDRVGVEGLYDRSPILVYDPGSPNEQHRHGKWYHRPYNAWLVSTDRLVEVETAYELFPALRQPLEQFLGLSFSWPRFGITVRHDQRWDIRISIHRLRQKRARHNHPPRRVRRLYDQFHHRTAVGIAVPKNRRKKKWARSKRREKRRCGSGPRS